VPITSGDASLEGLFVAGTGSYAVEIADWARAAGERILGLVEMRDPSRVGSTMSGLPVLGAKPPRDGARVVLGLGGDRNLLWEQLDGEGWVGKTVCHPAACLGSGVELAAGATVGPLAVLGVDTKVGSHSIISRGSLVGHHVEVGRFVTINPGVNIGGNAQIGDRAFIGMGATVVNGTRVGAGAVVAAGALVLGDVGDGARVQGIPARLRSP
jgi:sugar O-acyltransferase (sialic acid O-acetyltransferase NeuD family)